MAVVGQLLVVIGATNAPLTATLAASQAQLKGFSGFVGTTMAAARTALVGVGVGAAAGAVLGVKAAADFEDAFAGVRKTVNEAELAAAGLSFDDLAGQFRQMATEIPVSVEQLAAIGETAGALGIKAQDIDDFTKTVALMGATTDLSTDQAAEALGKVGTILGLTGTGFENFADILVALGNDGASTESEIIEVTKRFAAAGQAAGLSIPEILAFSSAIASAGVEPEAAGSSLSRLFGNMILGTANATKAGKSFAKLTGQSFREWSQLVKTDTVGAMTQVLQSLQGLDKFGQARALAAIGITNVRDVNAIRLLADTYDKNLVPALNTAADAQGALATEAEKRFDTFNSRLTLLGQNFNELLITIGTPLLPIATDFVASITAGAQALAAWIAGGAQLSSTFTPVIDGIVTAFGSLMTTAQEVGVVILDLATRVWEGGLNKVIGTAGTVIGSVIDMLTGLATAITTNEDVMNVLRTTADLIGQGFGIASDAVNNLLTFLGQLGEAIRTNEELMTTLAGIGDAIAAGFQAAGPAIQAVIDKIGEAAEFAGLVADEILRLAGGKGPAIKDMRNPDRNEGEPIDVALREWDPSNPDTDPIFGDFNRLIGGIGDVIFRGGKAPMEFANGGFVPGSGPQLAIVHGGEEVIPPGGRGGGIHLTHTTVLQVGEQRLGEIVERIMFNNASQYSSGFAPGSVGG